MTALATAAIAVLTYFYVEYSRKQWETMRQELTTSHRPWVNVALAVAQPLTLTAGGAMITVEITVKNGGTGPALSVFPGLPILVIGRAAADAIDQRRPFCEKEHLRAMLQHPITNSTGVGLAPLLLPNETIKFQGWNVSVQKNNFKLTSKYVLSLQGNPSFVDAWVTGCVGYLDEFREVHATVFNFQYQPTQRFLKLDGGTFPGVLMMDPSGNDAY